MEETLEEAALSIIPDRSTAGWIDSFGATERIGFIKGAKWQQEQILQFLYSEITERRPYSSSKMCEEVIKFIEQFKKNNMEKETLEEFINSQPYYGSCTTEYLEGIEEGAKWQQERMYSEEEVKSILLKTDRFLRADLDKWFEQFKKK